MQCQNGKSLKTNNYFIFFKLNLYNNGNYKC